MTHYVRLSFHYSSLLLCSHSFVFMRFAVVNLVYNQDTHEKEERPSTATLNEATSEIDKSSITGKLFMITIKIVVNFNMLELSYRF